MQVMDPQFMKIEFIKMLNHASCRPRALGDMILPCVPLLSLWAEDHER